ncbi:hypothetical protein [Aliamphritea spongicola]|nr:hypothetical protein [Aliamphritea spongicola]
MQGYLYVILGGQLYDNIEDGIQDSYSRSMVLVAIAVITLAAILAGWLIFRLLVRRLGMLSQAMHSFSEQNLDHCRSDLQQPATAPCLKMRLICWPRRLSECQKKSACSLKCFAKQIRPAGS